MTNFNECKNASLIKAKIRETISVALYKFFCEEYGNDVLIINNNKSTGCADIKTITSAPE